ncbi:hypothetical protein ILUMI_24737 [Ignelater luminosus]|uniref:Craniofacial development protein 2-like n=1 Tax=Ignelater luminosus TaxID=2038154 RepID=A0A8K0C9P6_IGNLU|nr:hypothetical protein ILUMI_24737 [Ignelater luminosus]
MHELESPFCCGKNLFGIETIAIWVYTSKDDNTQQIKDQFYWSLSQELNKIKKHQDIVTITSDFNARVSSQENEEVVGKYGGDVANNSGEDLIELYSIRDLFHRRLEQELNYTTNISNEIEEEYGNIKRMISKVARGVLETKSKRKEKSEPPWMSN